MLLEIRERAQGWIAYAIIILISIPFALWGIQSYLGGGGEQVVAEVNGNKITDRQFSRNVQRARMELRERLGDAYDPELFGGQRLRQQILDSMISDVVLLDASRSMGLRVSDQAVRAAILGEPAFQRDGTFDNDAYKRVLQLQGLTPAAYEEQLRTRLLATQLPRAVSDTEFVTAATVNEAARLLEQQREIAYVSISASELAPEAPPSDEEIQAFYDENQALFQTPEQVRIAYLLLDADALAARTGDVAEADDEDALRQLYEERIDEFTEPEQRAMRHILIAVAADAADAEAAAAKERLAALRERILAGDDFADVAEEVSDDPGSAADGGDLGLVGRGLMDPLFEQAAFALDQGELSEPIRTPFGYHLIEVTEIRGGEPRPFEEVRDELAQQADSGRGEALYFDVAERLATLAYEAPDSLIPAAETLDMEIQTSDWIDRSGGEGVLANPKVIGAAFSEDVLTLGNNSELIEPERDVLQAIVLRVDDHRPPATRPLEEVREDIVSLIRERKAAEAALAASEDMVRRLREGAALEDVAGEYSVETPGLIGRNAPDVPPRVLELAFTLPRPAEDAPSYASGAGGAGAVVVAVSRVVDGNPVALEPERLESEARLLADARARQAFEALRTDLESRAKIERAPLPEETP
ncbi:MAG: SurA N-terminal domain-containing protein [Thiohalocapsa sp.]|nr:SurA N-terminal domain-containing protein [Thiohalocapsa sp.]